MSDGILQQKSTLGIVMKNGVSVSTASVWTPLEAETAYFNCQNNNTQLRVISGDKEGTILLIDTKEISIFTVRRLVDEQIAAQQMQPAKRPSNIIQMR